MATKLKHLKVKKVDFVDEGANPEAHIKLFKRNDEGKSSAEDSSEKSSGVLKRLIAFIAKAAGMPEEEVDSTLEEIQKGEALSFGQRYSEVKNRKIAEEMWDLCFALQSSLCSILNDEELDRAGTAAAMQESLEEFYQVVTESIKPWSEGKETSIVRKNENVTETELEVMKSAVKRLNETIEKAGSEAEPEKQKEEPKGVSEMSNIDKSKMTPAERAFYEDIEKRYGRKDSTKDSGTTHQDQQQEEDVTKSKTQQQEADSPESHKTPETDPGSEDIYKGLHPAVKAEMEALRKFREDAEDKEIHEVAKKYAVIGKKEEELFPVLKSLKSAGGTAYNDMIAVLDQAVVTVEKSGAFTEIGKSGGSGTEDNPWAKAEVKATEIMKAKTGITRAQALDEVFLNDPELAAVCEKEG